MRLNKVVSYILCNKDIIVNLYKLHFLSSHFSLNQTKVFSTLSFFHPSNQTHMRENQIFSIIILIFYISTFLLLQPNKP